MSRIAPSDNRTNVRISPTAPWPLRAGMAAAGALAPPLASRLGLRLFLTPPRHRAPSGEGEALARARPFAIPFRGGRLRAWRFGEGPTVLLVHGWGGRGGQMAPLVPALLERGLSAVAFDGPGHGASSGRLASVPLLADAVAEVASRADATAVIGHSMGAAAAALAVVRGLTLDAAVLVAPPRGPGEFFRDFSLALGLHPRLERAVRERIERHVGMSLGELDLPRLAEAQTTPVLVVHDRGDREVPFSDGEAIASAWPGARLVATEGRGHRRILRDPEVAAGAAEFVRESLGRRLGDRAA